MFEPPLNTARGGTRRVPPELSYHHQQEIYQRAREALAIKYGDSRLPIRAETAAGEFDQLVQEAFRQLARA